MSEYRTPDYAAMVQEDGSVVIPASYLERLGLRPGRRVEVRITERLMSQSLREKGVTEEDVELIGERQLEARENVLTFLSSEGSLAASRSSAARLRRWLRSSR